MRDVNWWLMILAFLLGLLLTLAMMIRRVTREVPVTHAVSAAVATAAAAKLHDADKTVTKAAAKVEKKLEHAEKKVEKAVEKTVQKVQHVDVIEQVPYGQGSIRVTARTVGPAGYTIKGDKDTGRYFTTDSPDYAAIEAEVWFANEESAQKAGFLRWDAKGARAALGLADGAAAVVREDHTHADTTIVIKGGDTVPSEATIRIISDGDN